MITWLWELICLQVGTDLDPWGERGEDEFPQLWPAWEWGYQNAAISHSRSPWQITTHLDHYNTIARRHNEVAEDRGVPLRREVYTREEWLEQIG